MLHQSEPIRAFVEECCVLDPDASVEIGDVWEVYSEYSRSQHGVMPLSRDRFAERICEIFPTTRPYKPHGAKRRIGLQLNNKMAAQFYVLDAALLGLGQTGWRNVPVKLARV
jgi:hypothetical protein